LTRWWRRRKKDAASECFTFTSFLFIFFSSYSLTSAFLIS
jgi:hypothetical protein